MGLPATGLAKWDGSNWQVPITFGGGQIAPVVKTLFPIADRLFLAGDFDQANGQPATNAMVIQNDTITPLNAPVYPNVYGGKFALTAFGNRVFLGGDFVSRDLTTTANLVEITDGVLKPLVIRAANNVPDYSRAICTDGTNVFVAGDYGHVGTNKPLAVAKWNGAKWSTAAPAINPGMTINHIAVIGSNVFVAGNFNSSDLGVTNFACWNGQNWSNIGPASTSAIDSMLVLGTNLYVTGTFSDTSTSCKWWDGSKWTRVPWFPQTFFAQRLATDGTDVYIARQFPANAGYIIKVARWTGGQLIELPGQVPLYSMSAFAVSGTNIFIAGSKTSGPYDPHISLFRWDGANGSETPTLLGSSDEIAVMTGFGANLIVAGRFRSIAGLAANSIAEWDNGVWRSLDNGLASLSYPGNVMDLAVLGNRLLMTGGFDQAGQSSSGNIAVWNATADIRFGAPSTTSGSFQISGGIGDRVEIETSDDLATWTKVSDLQFSSPTENVANSTSNGGQRFYRAKILEP